MAYSQTVSVILSMQKFKHRCLCLIASLLFLNISIVISLDLGWEISMLLKMEDGEI